MFGLSSIAAYIRRLTAVMTSVLILLSSGFSVKVSLDQLLVRGVAPHLLSVPSYSFYEPTVKIPRTGALDKTAKYTVYAARNESEYCQIALQTRLDRHKAKVTLTPFTNENGDRIETVLCEEYYVKTTGDTIFGTEPDALIPAPIGEPYNLAMMGERNYPFFIGLQTAADTAPGDYTATLTLTCNEDTENKHERLDVEIRAHIWDFTLPEKPSMDTAMGLGRGNIAAAHHVDANSAKADSLYRDYYEFLLAHKISAYDLPVNILSDEADAYMSDPRCTSFCIPYADDDTIRAYYEKLSAHPEWAGKAYFYPIDEPADKEAYDRYNAICDRLSSLYPGYNMVTPFYANRVDIDGEPLYSVELQNGKSSFMCPESPLFEDAQFREIAYRRQAKGDKLWWYVCCGPSPTSGYCNLFTQQEGILHRILFWQQKQYNVTGLLYWSTTYWNDVGGDPWTSAWTTPWTGVDTFGDGSLLYDGYHLGIDGPVSSLRLEAVTNGIEDYEYLTVAEKLLGRAFVEKTIAAVCRDLTHFTHSDAQFAKTRISLGNAIEKALRG